MTLADPSPRTELRIWRIVARAAADAPWWGRMAIFGSALVIVVLTVAASAVLAGSGQPDSARQITGMILAHTGLLLLGMATLLHQITQHPDARGNAWRLPLTLRSARLDRLLVALPMMAFVSGVLLSSAVAVLLPTLGGPNSARLAVAIELYLVFLLIAANTVRVTTRFLYRHAREQADAAAEARHAASQARLAALQGQLNPHFLFNALNTVAALVRTDPPQAERTVEHLARILRRTLDRSRSSTCRLEDELDFLEAYLAIERERFGSRLDVRWEVDPAVRQDRVPVMALQPLVENALKHGVANSIEGGTITVVARRANGHLTLAVRDNGIGFPPAPRPGTGLANLRDRLMTLYGEGATLEVTSGPGDTVVSMTLPIAENSPPGRLDARSDR